jgi:hypothetical protein
MTRAATMLGLFGAIIAAAGAEPPANKPLPPNKRLELLTLSPKQLFKRIDADRDGQISREEFKAFVRKVAPGMARNKPELPDRVFDRADMNGDGYLNLEEFKELVTRLRQRMGQQNKKAPPQ